MVKIENTPEVLQKDKKRWVCHKDKVPKDAVTGKNALSNKPETWSTFEQAIKGAKKYKFDGIGFMLGGGIVGVDIDHCRDPKTGEISEIAKDIISALDSYTEYSPSGTGIHIICRGELPPGERKNPKLEIEMYDSGRYFTVTGNVLDDAHMDIEERTTELAQVHEKYLKKQKPAAASPAGPERMPAAVDLDEDEIIQRACASKKGSLFKSLMSGQWEGQYSSQSEADLALCNMIACRSNGDSHKVDSIFRKSGLMRPKWNEKHGELTYGAITIQKAIQDCIQTYNPNSNKNVKKGPVFVQKTGKNDKKSSENGKKVEKNDVNAKPKKKKKPGEKLTDYTNAEKMIIRHGDHIKYNFSSKTWLIWTGKQWDEDRTGEIIRLAKETIRSLYKEAYKIIDDQKRTTHINHAIRSEGSRSLNAMIELARSEPEIPVLPDALDADPFLLNCQNGVVDLRTGKLLPHNQKYLMTKITGSSYSPKKAFRIFDKFLSQISCGDPELALYFQMVCGMAAIGKVFHEGIAIFYGSGWNGKTTFLTLISKVFGDYACTINPEILMYQKDGRQINGTMSVEAKRFVATDELEEGRRMSSAMLKKLSSAGKIIEKKLYENERAFEPSHTIIMATNHLPKVGSTDKGTWRRIAVVPFKAVFKGKNEIKGYADELFKIDGDAVLSWIVEGAMKYIANDYKLQEPKAVREATEVYRNTEDWLGNFINECCEQGPFSVKSSELFEVYKRWCDTNNEHYKRSVKDFAAELETRGFVKEKTNKFNIWNGLKVRENYQIYDSFSYKKRQYKQTTLSFLPDEELDEDGLDTATRMDM